MLPTVPRKFRRNTDGNGSFLGIFKIPNGSPTAIIYPRIFVGVFRGICLPRYFIGIFRGNSEETQILVFSEFSRKFVGIFRGSHFPSECPSELRCFLVVQGNQFRALIYEFMPNGSLDMWLHSEEVEEIHRPSRTLTLLERLHIAIDVAYVLDYLHVHCHEAIAHCDLKPRNVLLDNDLTAHVSDFGLARILLKFDQEYFLNQLSSAGVRGTIGYAAPEYGLGGQISTHGDVYSFGILVLEMFSGKRPTNEVFGENFTLCSYVKSALPERVLEVADEFILHSGLRIGFPAAKCLTLVFEVGLRCCEESPVSRLAMSEAVKELISIRESFFRSRRRAAR